MKRSELAARFIAAWNNRDVDALLALMHPQASYFDAFWGEVCSGGDLAKYFGATFSEQSHWYEKDGDLIPTSDGFILRYKAFDRGDKERTDVLFRGAEIVTMSGKRIIAIRDYYIEPDPELLLEVAERARASHGKVNVVSLGLSGRTAARIKLRLAELASEMTVFLDPSLTVTKLANHIPCSVMHLFHVLEEEKGTTFINFANECRARYASTLLVDHPHRDISLAKVASDSGFESIADLDAAFGVTFGISIDEYVRRFAPDQTSR